MGIPGNDSLGLNRVFARAQTPCFLCYTGEPMYLFSMILVKRVRPCISFMKFNALTPEESSVIEGKGTEPPFSGEYDKFSNAGIYLCRRCNAPLYRSENKFDAQCGWPAFDDEVPGAVRRIPDIDGSRTEIICARCGAHLGHVFLGERLTPRDTRHCVNSLSMRFVPQGSLASVVPEGETAYFGGGCFWCIEAAFRRIRGVTAVIPGYAGGTISNPTYEEVSAGKTGHAEVVRVEYDPASISYEALLGVFFTVHDPTTPDRQGADVGTQYRSVIFCVDEIQKEIAEKFVRTLEMERVYSDPIVTEITPLSAFYPAEEYHRDYFAKHPEAAYCQAVINPKLAKLRKQWGHIFQGAQRDIKRLS